MAVTAVLSTVKRCLSNQRRGLARLLMKVRMSWRLLHMCLRLLPNQSSTSRHLQHFHRRRCFIKMGPIIGDTHFAVLKKTCWRNKKKTFCKLFTDLRTKCFMIFRLFIVYVFTSEGVHVPECRRHLCVMMQMPVMCFSSLTSKIHST